MTIFMPLPATYNHYSDLAVLINFVFQNSYKWNHTVLLFHVFLLFNEMFWNSSILLCISVWTFVLLNCSVVLLCVVIPNLFILSSANGHLCCFYFGLLWIELPWLLWIFLYKSFFRHRHSILLGVYLGVEMLYYRVSVIGDVNKCEKCSTITKLSGMENMPRLDLSISFFPVKPFYFLLHKHLSHVMLPDQPVYGFL